MSINHSNNPEYDEVAISRPFNGLDLNQTIKLKDEFIKVDGLREKEKLYVLQGALLACDSMAYCRRTEVHISENKESHRTTEVTDGRVYVDERDFKLLTLEKEELDDGSTWKVVTSFWQKRSAYPTEMYILITCCSLGAAVQGWDETAVNGGMSLYSPLYRPITPSYEPNNYCASILCPRFRHRR
ncbi:hypothetical protein F5B21DRAFT_336505 [Xylaria acuta]|nr:hypothetical protein F5B21DRAFT_336505 [Xylaria acuta]